MTTPPPDAVPGTATVLRGPVTAAERSPAPDLARGVVLLFIALANVPTYFYGRTLGPADRPVGGSPLDGIADVVVSAVVDRRSYPMFAMLFGYGMVALAGRQLANGADWPAVRGLLARRNLWLLVFGAVHALLLFDGDILGPYGAIGLVALPFLRRSPRVLAVWAAVALVPLAVALGLGDAGSAGDVPPASAGYLGAAGDRLLGWGITVGVLTVLLVLLAPTLVGVLIARAGLLDRPAEHRATLRRIAGVGVPVGVLGGLPFGLAVGGFADPGPAPTVLVSALHAVTGVAGGAGYLALFGLWAARGRPTSPVGAALAATGERSLTCYLGQSLLLAPLLSSWGAGLGGRIGSAAAYGLALAVWLSGVALAVGLARAGRRGPAEALLRRLTYGRPARAAPSRAR